MDNLKESTIKTNEPICVSKPVSLKSVFLPYVVVIAVVCIFQIVYFIYGIVEMFQIIIFALFIAFSIISIMQANKDSKKEIVIYKDYFSFLNEKHKYSEITDMSVHKNQLVIKTKKKQTFYFENADEIYKAITMLEDKKQKRTEQ